LRDGYAKVRSEGWTNARLLEKMDLLRKAALAKAKDFDAVDS
jgi:hypothetical protein